MRSSQHSDHTGAPCHRLLTRSLAAIDRHWQELEDGLRSGKLPRTSVRGKTCENVIDAYEIRDFDLDDMTKRLLPPKPSLNRPIRRAVETRAARTKKKPSSLEDMKIYAERKNISAY